MDINRINLDTLFTGYNAVFNRGFQSAKTEWRNVAMLIPSVTEKEIYAWLGQIPGIREWIGDRVINSLMTKGYTLENKDFESTVAVPRNKILDDMYGVYSPLIEELGRVAAVHPDEQVFATLSKGFTEICYDGQRFFDTDHPISVEGKTVSVANTDGGDGPAWFLLDNSRALRPLIYQERQKFNLVRKDQENDDNVFFRKEYIYGVDGRSVAGFGLWQLAWGSKQTLDAAHYEVARTHLQTLKGDEGRPLGLKPTTLVVSPQLESAAFDLINSATLANGASNKWYKSVEVIVTPWAA
ncbi:Mu-like prophage major head subunit gpT family protein [Agrobacterium pusense]|uniref:Mu-like prophage major head subunit gpT family protein n=1 Tax=Agrobacterium pusense TaxID=648995 RepID=A0AA44EJ53_9HYPH|nr:Mu-like prophage major head subunit gpT family protein [Agrobacterium pusense]NRF09399.1 Mu-like prophage major head subunit gpT family protein [Agrobacterium pusense]NRF19696.1 Mu-like prophage major head subunit gpT family protein [Agrobacterium pusense]